MKKTIVALIAALVLCASCFSLAACGKDPDAQFVVATNAEFAPFEYMKGDKFVGIDMEIAKLMADEFGMDLVIKNMGFDAVCMSVGKNGIDVGMAGLTVTAEREKTVNFSEPYYEGAYQMLVVKKDETKFDECKTANDVEKLLKAEKSIKIGVQKGTTAEFYVEGNPDMKLEGFSDIECSSYESSALAVEDMLNGKVNYVVVDNEPAKQLEKQKQGTIKLIDIPLTTEKYAFAVDKNQPELLKKINAYIKKIKDNGVLKGIFDKYDKLKYDEDGNVIGGDEKIVGVPAGKQ